MVSKLTNANQKLYKKYRAAMHKGTRCVPWGSKPGHGSMMSGFRYWALRARKVPEPPATQSTFLRWWRIAMAVCRAAQARRVACQAEESRAACALQAVARGALLRRRLARRLAMARPLALALLFCVLPHSSAVLPLGSARRLVRLRARWTRRAPRRGLVRDLLGTQDAT